MSSKEYRKKYYQENKEKIKQYQKDRYESLKETKMKDLVGAVTPNSNGGNNTFFSISGPTKQDPVSPQNIMQQLKSWIYTCSNINAAAVGSQDLHLYATVEEGQNNKFLHKHIPVSHSRWENIKKNSSLKSMARVKQAENVVEIVDHPLITLLQNMNKFNNNYESFELTSIYLDMIGDAYWYIKKDEYGMPEEIWVLQGQYMKIVPAKRVFLKGYLYGVPDLNSIDQSKGLIKFNKDEIIHFKTPNPNSMYYGLGAAQAVIASINRMNSMDTSEQARLNNMGRPDFVVNYKGGKLDNKEIKKIERMWNGAFGGPSKDGKIKVFDEDFGLETLGFSPRDMEYLSGRIWSLKEIAGAFGVPYSMLDTSDTKKATSELADRWYAKNTILPKITRIAEKLNEQLVPLYDPSGRLFLNFDNPVPEDRELLMKENTEYVKAGILSVNEARLRLGMAALDDESFDIPKVGNSMPTKETEQPDMEDDDEE